MELCVPKEREAGWELLERGHDLRWKSADGRGVLAHLQVSSQRMERAAVRALPVVAFSRITVYFPRATACSHMVRPDNIEGSVDVMLFQDGIQPIWEDENNKRGGKWTIKFRKGLASRLWEEITLALIGEQFDGPAANEVCGAVMSIRFHDDSISVWWRSAENEAAVARIRYVPWAVAATF